MMPNLFLVEHYEQVDDLLSRGMKDKGQWIALGPSAMAALDKTDTPYRIPEDFYSYSELEEICLENHRRVEWLCNCMDEMLHERHPDLKKWNMRPFFFNIFMLTWLFDTLVSRIFQLRSVLDAHPSHKVWVHTAPQCLWDVRSITFSNKERLWGRLLSLRGWNRDINFLEESDKENIRHYLHRGMRSVIKKSFTLNNLVASFRLKDIEGLTSLIAGKPARSLLVHGTPYEWRHVLPLLRNDAWQVFFTDDRIFDLEIGYRKESPQLDNLVHGNSDLTGALSASGVSFYPLVRERLAWIFEDSAEFCRDVAFKVRRIVARYNIKAILAAHSTTFTSHAVEQAARYLGLPVLHWQHGFMSHKNGRITQLNDFNNMMTCNILLTYGEEATKAHLFSEGKFHSRIVSIGSASIDKVRKQNLEAKETPEKTIIYVPANYYQNHWYYGYNSFFNDRDLFKDQLVIIRDLDRIARNYQAHITVKLHPSIKKLPFLEGFIENFSPVLRVVKDSPGFSKLLQENNIIVIDLPTTTALEAMATKKPVFILTKYIGYTDEAREMLKKRAVCADDPRKLLDSVRYYVENGAYPADVNNDEYLKAHGTHLDDGNSRNRAVNEVLETILN